MVMKKCKECGKLFEAKSAKVQYCSAIHYRPCPVCGKPVVAKYLSDPARCCSRKCSAVRNSKASNDNVKPVNKSHESETIVKEKIVHGPIIDCITYGTGSENSFLEGIYDFEDALRGRYTCLRYIGKNTKNLKTCHEYAMKTHFLLSGAVSIDFVYDFKKSKKVRFTSSFVKSDFEKLFTDKQLRLNEKGEVVPIIDADSVEEED